MSPSTQIENIDPDYLNMPDDEIMNMQGTPAVPGSGEEPADPPAATPEGDPPDPEAAGQSPNEPSDSGQNEGGAAAEGSGEGGGGEGGAADTDSGEGGEPEGNQPNNTPAATPEGKTDEPGAQPPGDGNAPIPDGGVDAVAEGGKPKDTPATPAAPAIKSLGEYTAEEKAAAFDQVMKPFKANGKMIELRSPEEATKLLQMGANYTKKLQALQPHLRATRMLENNGLLDENKLSFAIDLLKGDPLAIQKLLADSQFDPMTVDKDKAADYTPGNYQVTDQEMAFQAALDDIEASDSGKQLLTEIAGQWDRESKEALFQHPEVLGQLNLQRELGLYEQITSEIHRLRTLGQIPQGTPFLQAYRAVGDMLHEQGRLKPKTETLAPIEEPKPVEVRTATPPAKVVNSAQARAAAPTKTNPAPASNPQSDILSLPDDEFLKQMQGRL